MSWGNILGRFLERTLSTVIEVLTVEVAVSRVPHLSIYLSVYQSPYVYISPYHPLSLHLFILSFPFLYEENFHMLYAHTATGFANKKLYVTLRRNQ